MTPTLRTILLGFAGLALIAGLLLFAGADETDSWFSWTIEPPLTAASLGAFYWAAFALLLAAANSPNWAGARPIAYPVLVIATVLLVVTLVHLDRFHLDSLFGIFWVCAYIVAPPLLAYGIVRQREARDSGRDAARPLPAPLRAAIVGEGAVMLAAGVVMLAAPETAADLWPWALTPLTSRALGAFVLGVALVAAFVARENRLVLFGGTAIAYAALGALQLLAVALHESDLGDDDTATHLYLGFLAAILATGLYGSIAARAASRS